MRIYRTAKKVLSINNKPEQFLGGLTANSLDKPRNAFVNIHGRIIATFDQLKINDEKFLLVIEGDFVQAVLDHVDRYARLSKTIITLENFFVNFDLDGDYKLQNSEFAICQKHGQLILTLRDELVSVSEEEFTLFRLKNNIPLLGVDYKDEMLLNVSETDFVSFTKGCFLGQEPIAKVHHRSRPTWVLKVKFEDECTSEEKAKMTSKVLDSSTGRILGFVFVKNK
ncbi:MAG: hypothetical protein H6754_02615 [Candidatus Omnitrophica bacterium]|nr:hypothetical protein [Candidatus Omnitrophota bacterium]